MGCIKYKKEFPHCLLKEAHTKSSRLCYQYINNVFIECEVISKISLMKKTYLSF